jgi:peptidyl-prolyl cis-trans isomerase SurA
MKKIKLIFSFLMIVFIGFSQQNIQSEILMTVGETPVTVDEFAYIYKKNNNKDNNTKEAVEEYLELFINYKLKVKEAQNLKLDTNPSYVNELAGYRKQLSQPYLVDRQTTDWMITEAYDRMKYDIHAKHILVKLPDNPTPKDTGIAYAKIKELYRKATAKNNNFDALMNEAKNQKSTIFNIIAEDLGYFTAFMMVYDFESAAYQTNVGEVSPIIKTKFGYHILKVYDKRPARGTVKTAHIMIAIPENADNNTIEQKKRKIEEIYQQLTAGEDFGKLARLYSDDKGTAKMEGQLPWFGPGRMVPEFEEAAFNIPQKGGFSAPIQTKYGFHIIKLIDKKEIGTFDEMKNEVKEKVNKDGRYSKSKTNLIKNIQQEYGYKPNMKLVQACYSLVTDDYKTGKWKAANSSTLTGVIFELHDQKYSGNKKQFTQADFVFYMEITQRNYMNESIKDFVDKAFVDYVNKQCIQFEDELLEQKYPDFNALMQEYKDGILLFEMMDKKVWSFAVKDTSGLETFYEKNKMNYMWEERCQASIYTCANESIANEIKKMLKKQAKKGFDNQAILNNINKSSELNVSIESKKFVKGENELIDQTNWIVGIKDNVKNDDKIIFVNVESILPPQPKSIDEARGAITSDYQKYLEQNWIAELKSKYNVTVNKEVLEKIYK